VLTRHAWSRLKAHSHTERRADALQGPRIAARLIHKTLWKDEDGADSEGLVTHNFFATIKAYVLRSLNDEFDRRRHEPIFHDALEHESRVPRKQKQESGIKKLSRKLKSLSKVCALAHRYCLSLCPYFPLGFVRFTLHIALCFELCQYRA
jgi:hypothetical protein